jgi:nucleoside-diphosphate-sugar epimerase
MKPMILVTGACGQIGTELVAALRQQYGTGRVIATDIRPKAFMMGDDGYHALNVMDKPGLDRLAGRFGITQIYHLASMLSASGEQQPLESWDLNMQGLINVLETAREQKLEKVFWPSSIAVFGPGSPRGACRQDALPDPVTMYGISKMAGEQLCRYYHQKYGLDVRSLRYPGLISHSAPPGGGTTDYAVDIFREALAGGAYTCYLREDTALPMLYMPDAVRAALELMEAPAEKLTVRTAYNLGGMSFSPRQLAGAIRPHIPGLVMTYAPDFRQAIADSWPAGIDDRQARQDWGWNPAYGLEAMTTDMLEQLSKPCSGPQMKLNHIGDEYE